VNNKSQRNWFTVILYVAVLEVVSFYIAEILVTNISFFSIFLDLCLSDLWSFVRILYEHLFQNHIFVLNSHTSRILETACSSDFNIQRQKIIFYFRSHILW